MPSLLLRTTPTPKHWSLKVWVSESKAQDGTYTFREHGYYIWSLQGKGIVRVRRYVSFYDVVWC